MLFVMALTKEQRTELLESFTSKRNSPLTESPQVSRRRLLAILGLGVTVLAVPAVASGCIPLPDFGIFPDSRPKRDSLIDLLNLDARNFMADPTNPIFVKRAIIPPFPKDGKDEWELLMRSPDLQIPTRVSRANRAGVSGSALALFLDLSVKGGAYILADIGLQTANDTPSAVFNLSDYSAGPLNRPTLGLMIDGSQIQFSYFDGERMVEQKQVAQINPVNRSSYNAVTGYRIDESGMRAQILLPNGSLTEEIRLSKSLFVNRSKPVLSASVIGITTLEGTKVIVNKVAVLRPVQTKG